VLVIKKVKFIKISRREFCGFNLHITKKTSGFKKSDYIGGANVGLTIARLNPLVEPAVTLREG
jgi:hypothetical protein